MKILLIDSAQKISKEFSDKDIEIYSFQDAIDLEVCQKFEKAVNMLNPSIKNYFILKSYK